ncbi:hypothetical protein D9V37_08570 [Nocardioides mangrovicus]|uniref:Uncharacterized protein n=1 Tax=Nocardioides mangrovicus TaxID=2478913 RepID=A0A3L8P4E0_9ACTN|nr:hypothetical protein [Nocardioides mangrovicus]RLV49922.1 hypothetical protein D9V37_08570 [Nocardioides mangrovicus]
MSRHRAHAPLRFRLTGSLLVLALCALPLVGFEQAEPVAQVSAAHQHAHHAAAHHAAKHAKKHTKKKAKKKSKKKSKKKHVTKHVTTPATTSAATAASAVASTPSTTVTTATTTTAATVSSAAVLATGAAKPVTGFLGSANAYRLDVSNAPLNSDSAGMVANLTSQVTSYYGGVAAFNVWNYNTTFYQAAASTPLQRVIWDNCQNKSYTPSLLYTVSAGAAFVDVPIPADAVAASGTDAELAIWSPSRDKLWEFWKAKKSSDGWHACWGGRIDSWSTSPGYFTNGAGATATGLPVASGAIGITEAQAGSINHALNLVVINAANYATYSYPAQRSDGNQAVGTAHAIPEGTRFRLDPTLDVDSLKLTPIAKAVAKAAQKYGFIVSDKGGSVGVQAESGTGVATVTGTNPWNALMAGVPAYNIMKNFPWSRLQALPMNYGKP